MLIVTIDAIRRAGQLSLLDIFIELFGLNYLIVIYHGCMLAHASLRWSPRCTIRLEAIIYVLQRFLLLYKFTLPSGAWFKSCT